MHNLSVLGVLLPPYCSSEIVVRPEMNRCDISEDDTTKALYALYQMPISEGQNNMQTHATGTAFGVSSNDALQFGLNHKKSSSNILSDRGKKKYVIKDKTMEGINNDMLQSSNSIKINAQESGKNRRLTGTNQHPADSNLMKKTSSKHFSKLNNLIEKKHVPKEKEKQISKGISLISELIYCLFRTIFMV